MFIIKNHFRQTQVGTKFAQESRGRPMRSSKQHISGSVSQRAPSALIHEPSIMSDSHSLVGGIPTPLKNMNSSAGIIIPNIWKNKSHVPNHQPVPNVFPYFEPNTTFFGSAHHHFWLPIHGQPLLLGAKMTCAQSLGPQKGIFTIYSWFSHINIHLQLILPSSETHVTHVSMLIFSIWRTNCWEGP